MPRNKIALCFTMLLLGCLAVKAQGVLVQGAAEASAAQLASAPVPGEYDPLTIWKTISLGTAYYTNPQRAREINVAYSFDGPEFSSDFKSKQLWELATQGKISFGITSKDKKTQSITVVLLAELQKMFPAIKGPDDLVKILAREDVMVVAGNKTLLGEASKAPVVMTEPPSSPVKTEPSK